MEAQLQIRRNVQEVQDAVKDLLNWEKDVKLKGMKPSKQPSTQPSTAAAAPIRGKAATITPASVDQTKKTANVPNQPPSSSKPGVTTTPDGDLSSEGWKERGNDLFKAGQFRDAKDCYTKSLVLQPTSVVYANRGLACLKLLEFAQAEEDCSKAIRLDATYLKAYQRRATARKNLDKMKLALEDFEYALRLEPTSQAIKADRDACLAAVMKSSRLSFPTKPQPLQIIDETVRSSTQTTISAPVSTHSVQDSAVPPTQSPAPSQPAAPSQSPAPSQPAVPSQSAAPPQSVIPANQPAQPSALTRSTHSSTAPTDSTAAVSAINNAQPLSDDPSGGGMQSHPAAIVTGTNKAAASASNTTTQSTYTSSPSAAPAHPAGVSTAVASEPAVRPNHQDTPSLPSSNQSEAARNGVETSSSQLEAASNGVKTSISSQPEAVWTGLKPDNSSQPEAASNGVKPSNSSPSEPASNGIKPSGSKGSVKYIESIAKAVVARREPSQKAPRTSTDFYAAWRGMKGDIKEQAAYLSLITAQQLPTVLKNSLTADLLTAMVRTLLLELLDTSPCIQPDSCVQYLEVLPRVPRFDMNIMCVKPSDKNGLKECLQSALSDDRLAALHDRLDGLKKKYRLN